MRLIFSLFAILFMIFGTLMLFISLKVDKLNISIGNFLTAMGGFGLLIAALIIGILVEILTELKERNNPH